MERIVHLLDKIIMAVLVLQGISLVGIVCLAVFFRYVVGIALSWPEEIAGIIFVWYTLLGIVVLVAADAHIAFDAINKYLPPVIGKAIKLLSQLIIILYGAVMAIYGWKYLKAFPFEESSAAGINLSWLKIAIPLTGTLIVIYVFINMITKLKQPSPDMAKDK